MNTRILRAGWIPLVALAVLYVCMQSSSAVAAPAAAQAVYTEALGDPVALNTAATPSPNTPLRLAFALNSKSVADAAPFVNSLTDPTSPNYHKWITPAQYGEKFGASASDINAVIAYLTAHGFTNIKASAARTLIFATATASQAEAAFDVKLYGYNRTPSQIAQGVSPTYYAPDKNPSIDSSVAPYVKAVFGLSSAMQTHPEGAKAPAYTPLMNPIDGAMDPSDLASVYNTKALHNQGYKGQGETIGIWSPTIYDRNDIQTFFNYLGLPANTINNVVDIPINGGADFTGGAGEACLDIETIVGQDPLATVNVYSCPMSDDGLDIFVQMEDDKPNVVSMSWGTEEFGNSLQYADAWETQRQIMAGEGISIFVASGDSGAYYTQGSTIISTNLFATSAYVTAVGGTELDTPFGAGETWNGEIAWTYNDGSGGLFDWGGSGGLSIFIPEPSWQTGPGVLNGSSDGYRQVPDISALASTPFYDVYTGGAFGGYLGTSCSTPLWASSIALINEAGKVGGVGNLGNIDPALYRLGSDPSAYATVFHDITSGNNGVYYCTPNWDFVTGWGSVDFDLLEKAINQHLAAALTPTITANPGFVEFSPPTATINDLSAGTTIYYNFTDAGQVSDGSWTPYTAPLVITQSGTLTAVASGGNYSVSQSASADFVVTTTTATPVISPSSGTYSSTQYVSITDTDQNANIYYTTDGHTPVVDAPDTTFYPGPITVATSQTITAMAVDGTIPLRPSLTASQQYTILQFAPTPTITPDGGPITGPETVTISDSLPSAAIYYYTTDAAGATTGYIHYTTPLTVSGSETITAVARATGYLDGLSASASFNLSNPLPQVTYTVQPAENDSNVYGSPVTVSLAESVAGATIYYTTDGTPPGTNSQIYTTPISVSNTETISAIATANTYTSSPPLTEIFTILQPAPTPVISPNGGVFPTSQNVTLTDTAAGVSIYYTLDGAAPVVTNSDTFLYQGALTVAVPETVTAIAVGSAYNNSSPAIAQFNITPIAPSPTVTPLPGPYLTAQTIALADTLGSSATIYYTTNGTPASTSSLVYSQPFQTIASGTETINAIAVAHGFINSASTPFVYEINQPAPSPTFTPAGGPYATTQNVVIRDSLNSAATIYYTTDGTAPTLKNGVPSGSTQLYSAPVTVASSETLTAIAVASGYLTSTPPSAASYLISEPVAVPTISPNGGAFAVATDVTLADSFAPASIYYTTDGILPVPGNADTSEYTASILSASTLVGATTLPVAGISGFTAGATVLIDGASQATAESVKISAVSSSPTPNITLAVGTKNPHASGATVEVPLIVSISETLTAVGTETGYNNSAPASASFAIGETAATPVISPNASASTNDMIVSIADTTPGVKIYYTTDGTNPTDKSILYQDKIALSTSATITAVAIEAGYTTSSFASSTYTIGQTVAAPTIAPAGGAAFATTQLITLADVLPGASIYYTTDGSAPTAASTLYTGPFNISTSETIKAIAVMSGYFNSAVTSTSYTIALTLPTPTISPNAGQYAVSQTVTILDAQPSAAVYYTTDGTVPTSSSTLYTGAISLSSSETIQAIAVESGFLNSGVASASFAIAPVAPTPTIAPNGGSIAKGKSVTITSSLANATIYYTLDGSTPTTSSSVYSQPIVVNSSETITAIVVASGYSTSAAASAAFTATTPVIASFSAGLQLMSLPESYSGVSLDSIFGYSGVKLAVWNAASNYYPITPTAPANEIIAGQGYWVRFPINVSVTLAGTATPTNTPFVIPLHAGWNMIGDPFTTSVSLSSLSFSGETTSFAQATSGANPMIGSSLYAYDNGSNEYTNAGSLDPSHGYWIFAFTATDLDIPAPLGS
jgi:subtilase family serine protease